MAEAGFAPSAAEPATEPAPLPKLSAAEYKIYNSMADLMDVYVLPSPPHFLFLFSLLPPFALRKKPTEANAAHPA
jgi:hypothetical protein